MARKAHNAEPWIKEKTTASSYLHTVDQQQVYHSHMRIEAQHRKKKKIQPNGT